MARTNGRREAAATKGERTRALIVERAAVAYNVRGFAGLSIAEVLERTGLEKGGLYNHFASKDDLALAAFDHLMERIHGRIVEAMDAAGPRAAARLLAMAGVYHEVGRRPFMPGGCPLLNTATEADDTHPALRARALAAMRRWHDLVRVTVEDGVRAGEFRADIDASACATVIIAAIEGGILMSKLYRDDAFVRGVATFVTAYIGSLA